MQLASARALSLGSRHFLGQERLGVVQGGGVEAGHVAASAIPTWRPSSMASAACSRM